MIWFCNLKIKQIIKYWPPFCVMIYGRVLVCEGNETMPLLLNNPGRFRGKPKPTKCETLCVPLFAQGFLCPFVDKKVLLMDTLSYLC